MLTHILFIPLIIKVIRLPVSSWKPDVKGWKWVELLILMFLMVLKSFWEASRLLDLKGCVGIESRVFVPEFSDREINSPGEPGISYHMGTGFTTTEIPEKAQVFLDNMRRLSSERNQAMVQRVNEFLSPLTLDYSSDVLPLTPNGNATERHLCLAYARKAAAMYPEESDLRKFWSEKLGVEEDAIRELPEGRAITDLIRAKTMKQGGVGYVKPDSGSFPKMAEMNEFVLLCGAIPTFTWLDGCSAGEQSIEELIEVGRQAEWLRLILFRIEIIHLVNLILNWKTCIRWSN